MTNATEPVTIEAMTAQVATGAAVPLDRLGGVPGPVRWHNTWWAVPDGTQHYRPITDKTVIADFDNLAHRRRLATSATQNSDSRSATPPR